MNCFKITCFLILTFLFQTATQAQDWTSYQSQLQVNDLVETENELLLATDAGLVVVNKTTLEKTVFNKSNSNLSNNHIQTITQAPDGSNWIGTYDDIVARFDGANFQDATTPDHPALDQYTELYDFKIAENGDFWMATNDGVFHRQGQSWSHYDEDEFGPNFFEAWDIAIDENGVVFVASFDIYKFENGLWTNITEATDIHAYLDADLFFSSTGDLYFSGDLDKIGRFDGQDWETYGLNFNGSQVLKFTEDVNGGDIYFNTQTSGVFKLVNGAFEQQSDAQTEAFNNVTPYFHIDEENRRWLNKSIYLSVNDNGNIQTILISDHTLENNWLSNVAKGENGNMYFITGSEENISVVDSDGNWSFLPKPAMAMQFESFYDLLAFADNDIWLASQNGLYHYNGADWTLTALEACSSFDVDSQGKVYVKSSNRIYMLDNGVISEYNVNNSSISTLIISGHGIDANDDLWIASFDWDGEAQIQKVSSDGNTWTTYTNADHPIIERPVGDFHFDNNGSVWIPNDNVGAIKFDGTEFTNPYIGNLDQMASYAVSDIESDATGMLYLSHQYGATTLLDGEWGDLLIEDVPNVNSSTSSNMAFDDDGTLWWGSNVHGVFSYSTETTSIIRPANKPTIGFSVYPNPAGSYTVLDFVTPKDASVNVLVYNCLGQLTSSLDLGRLVKGTHQQTINVADFPKGIYTLQLQIENNISTKKIIVQ